MSDDATRAQIGAARPDLSTWLSANAGSGKTRVLTDRVARLLLNKVEPQHILCLTYTKAAATEMQNRLFRRLGAWSMKPDAALRADLAELGEGEGLTDDRLALARQLFARAIETPGGLRIQTIHSFCATLLRRYPLEAEVSPGFAEMDDRTARQMRDEIVQDMADRLAPDAVAGLARHYTAEDFQALMAEICSRADDFAEPLSREAAYVRFGLSPNATPDSVLAEVFLGAEDALIGALVPAMLGSGITDQKLAARLRAVLPVQPDLRTLTVFEDIFLSGPGAQEPFKAKIDKVPAKAVRSLVAAILPALEDLMRRVESARARRVAMASAEKTLALHRFADRFLPLYRQRKEERGQLDFDDLIRKAGRLLNDPALASWVLFRLDGGIDHILVDEAQDTSPQQWAVIERLTEEFTSGAGVHDHARTLFVVGDKKQSIYSFQGADLSAFDSKRLHFRQRFEEVRQPMQDRTLDYSFRSSRAILDAVDATFGNEFPAALGDAPRHLAFFPDMPGRVDLWPLIPPAEKTKDEDGWSPVDLKSDSHHTVELARQIAGEISHLIANGTQIPTAKGPRPVHAGDFLILVQRRSDLFGEIIRACKKAGLPIAGADRLKLGAELAVKDLTALLAFLATPEDNLSLAALLRSPLFGWSEDQLYRLAHGRKGFLWAALRESGHTDTLRIITDLRDDADFLRPYEILERMLTRHGGRERLLTRLGPEAEDGIDELLTQALAYEQTDVPSLTGFLVWLESDEVEVKRQLDSEGHNIRVMTVHGSKGLEAPIVILPDTADRKPQDRAEIYRLDDGVPVWKTPSAESHPDVSAAKAERAERTAQENLRLLYVALTRARCWLIVAGAGEAKTSTKDGPKPRTAWAWYRQVEAGLKAMGARPFDDGRLRHAFGDWPPNGKTEPPLVEGVDLPAFVWTAAPPPVASPEPLSPSDLGGAKAIFGDGDEVEVAKARGTALHHLLEHMPGLDPSDWPGLAVGCTPDGLDPAALLQEAAGVLAAPELVGLFGPDSLAEVTLTADLLGRRMVGTIDRLVIGLDRIWAVDFKSNREVPPSAAQVPEGILRQMGAYAQALAQIYPGRRIETAILWTNGPKLMPLEPDIVTAALARATIP